MPSPLVRVDAPEYAFREIRAVAAQLGVTPPKLIGFVIERALEKPGRLAKEYRKENRA